MPPDTTQKYHAFMLSGNVNTLLYRCLIPHPLYYPPLFSRLVPSREKRASFPPEKAMILGDERISMAASRRKKNSCLHRIIASRADPHCKAIVREIKIVRG